LVSHLNSQNCKGLLVICGLACNPSSWSVYLGDIYVAFKPWYPLRQEHNATSSWDRHRTCPVVSGDSTALAHKADKCCLIVS
jgi:hypothetical protein